MEKLIERIAVLEENDTENAKEILAELEKLELPDLVATLRGAKNFKTGCNAGYFNFARAIPNKDIFHKAMDYITETEGID
jgi:hypothetical protein